MHYKYIQKTYLNRTKFIKKQYSHYNKMNVWVFLFLPLVSAEEYSVQLIAEQYPDYRIK